MRPSVFSTLLGQSLSSIEAAVNADQELIISAARLNLQFGIRAHDSDELLRVLVENGNIKVSIGESSDELFTLSAQSSHWREFFASKPKAPFQSYWGILRCLTHEEGVRIDGDIVGFGRNARVWRLILDRIRNTIHGRQTSIDEDAYKDEEEDDSLVGRYIWVDVPRWGRCKVFYECAGNGPQDMLFLHTAGADSRQFHSLMNNKQLQERCTMYAFDLPGHGRSYPGAKVMPEGYGNDEDSYIAVIREVIEKLKLYQTIVSGASMAGHICLAIALRAKELGVSGVIPCEACDHLPFAQPIYELGSDLNESILNPERVCGMISPTAPSVYYRLIWWIYSSQGVKMFPGDLQFYFKGWDGRDRMHLIDTKACPIYMLTGEYDYSCTPEASRATAKKIPGAAFTEMKGLGHFPMSEDPKAFLPYLLKGIGHLQEFVYALRALRESVELLESGREGRKGRVIRNSRIAETSSAAETPRMPDPHGICDLTLSNNVNESTSLTSSKGHDMTRLGDYKMNSRSMPKHVGPNILPNYNVFTKLLGYASQGEAIAIHDVTNSYAATHLQLLTDVLNVRNVLYDLLEESIRQRLWKGEEVFFNLLGPASYEFAVGFLAVLALGGVIVPLAPSLPVQEAVYYVQTSTAECVLTTAKCSELGNDLARHISSTSKPTFESIELKPLVWQPPLQTSGILISQDHLLDYHGAGLVIFTSGTTGPPKGVVRPRTYLDSSAQRNIDNYGIGRGDVVMHGLPVHHATGIGTTLMPFLLGGSCIEFHSGGFDPALVWERWRQGGITFYSGVPTIYMRLMRYYETHICKLPAYLMNDYVAGARQIKALMCGTSALPSSLQQKWALLAGKRILERYGATEFSSCFTIQPNDVMNCPDGSAGKVMAGNDVKLSDGDEGEILMKSPFMFSKYLFNPKATAEAFDSEGYYKTGDVGRREGDYYFILGRASVDILKSGGYKISALDVEREIIALDYVSEVMVIGVEDDEFGQRVAAALVVKDPEMSGLALQTLREDLRSKLAGYKLPTMLRIVPELPKTATGKVVKKKLKPEFFPPDGHPDVQRKRKRTLSSESPISSRDGSSGGAPGLQNIQTQAHEKTINGVFKPSITHTNPGSYLGRAEYLSSIVPIEDLEEDARNYAAGREADVPELDMNFLRDLHAFELPARSIRESLISHFMDRCRPWMPIIDISDLEQTSTFVPSTLLLQAVFVAGSRVSTAPQAQSTGHAFYRRAKALYYLGAEKDPLAVIRAICILQWWNPSGPEHISMDASSFWLHMGVALAHQVGLHREPSPKQPDFHLRRRLWWTLFTRDCLISMSHGRPRAVNPSDTDVRPITLSDFPSSDSHTGHLFVAYVEICSILGDLTESCVRGNLSRSLRLEIETHLATWISSIPQSLQLHSLTGGLSSYNFLSRQLHIPYFTALTILFRPTSPSTPPSAVALLSSSFVTGIFEDFLTRGEIPILAPAHVFHMQCAAITQLACYRYPTLWSKASAELDILNQALMDMSKRYPTAFGAQRVVRYVERAVKKQDQYPGALHLGLLPDQLLYFASLGPELCAKWNFVHNTSESTIGERAGGLLRADIPIPQNVPQDFSSMASYAMQDSNQFSTSISMAPSAWDGAVGSAEFPNLMSSVIDGVGMEGPAEVPFNTIGDWMLNDWMTDLGW